jgi:hypothetical protein
LARTSRAVLFTACLALLVLLSASSARAAPKKHITGKLSKPGYTLIALAADGKARSTHVRRSEFRLKAPAREVTLHLRARSGKYAGPVVIAARRGGRRALLGVRTPARLGRITVRRSHARVRHKVGRRHLVASRYARARRGVPIGAGRFGRVRSRRTRGGIQGDRDLDGIPNVLDIDDDGDRVLDNLDGSRGARGAQYEHGSGAFLVHAQLDTDLVGSANANIPGLTDSQIEAVLPSFGWLAIEIREAGAELDCGTPQARTDPTLGGLVYCSKGGTGRVMNGQPEPEWPRFPECCDADDGDGMGTMVTAPNLPPGDKAMFLRHGATSTQIGTGDLLLQRLPSGGDLLATLQYVLGTTPALVSYDDGQGNSATTDYPVSANGPGTRGNPFPVEPLPGGDVVVTLTFWRPQRRPIPPETGDWIDIGGLNYRAALAGMDPGGFTCEQGAYSSTDPNLTPTDPTPEPGGGGFADGAADRPATATNTLTYRLNLTECLESKGQSFKNGEQAGFGFAAVTSQMNAVDASSVSIFFTR